MPMHYQKIGFSQFVIKSNLGKIIKNRTGCAIMMNIFSLAEDLVQFNPRRKPEHFSNTNVRCKRMYQNL